jgi:hypothetical protein
MANPDIKRKDRNHGENQNAGCIKVDLAEFRLYLL